MNASGEMWFESECEAKVYLDNWLADAKGHGWGKVEWAEWVQPDEPLHDFSIPVDHSNPVRFFRSGWPQPKALGKSKTIFILEERTEEITE